MAYNTTLVNKVREFLSEIPDIEVEEKEMFAVLNFMVNGKTCVCVSGENLILRFNPKLQKRNFRSGLDYFICVFGIKYELEILTKGFIFGIVSLIIGKGISSLRK
jgi:hypothetical protein